MHMNAEKQTGCVVTSHVNMKQKITDSFSTVKAGPVKQSIWLSRQVLTKWT